MEENGNNGDFSRKKPLHSQMAGETDMVDLIEFFVSEIQQQVGAIEQAWQTRSHADLRSIAHRLKDAGSSYGYPGISNTAAELERLLLVEEMNTSGIEEQVEALIDLCRRACMAPSDRNG